MDSRNSWITFGLFIIAIALISERHLYSSYSLNFDKFNQIVASGNYSRGLGISDCSVSINDVSVLNCKPQTWWASGYPIIVYWLNYVTNDFLLSDSLLIFFSILLFLLASGYIFKSFSPPETGFSTYNLFLLFSAFSLIPLIYLTTTDFLSFSFFLLGIALLIVSLEKNSFLLSFILGNVFFISSWFRYSSYPFLILPLLAFIYLFSIKKDKKIILHVLIYLATIFALFGFLWFFLPDHLTNQEAKNFQLGWNLQHLLQMDSFGLKAFFNVDIMTSRFSNDSTIFYIISFTVKLISLVISIATIIFFIKNVKSHYFEKKICKESFLSYLGVLTIVINISYLIWLSVRLPLFPQPNNPVWTFVWETRYFIPAIFFIQLLVFSLCSKHISKQIFPLTMILARIFIISCIAIAILLTAYTKLARRYLLNENIQRKQVENVVFEDENLIRKLVSMESRTCIMDFQSLALASKCFKLDRKFNFTENIQTSKPVVLFFLLDKNLSPSEIEVLNNKKISRVEQLSNKDLYRIEINPLQ